MEAVRENIVRIVALSHETMEKLLAKLEALGVQSVNDLVEVQVEDLTPEILLPIAARKLIRAWTSVSSQTTIGTTPHSTSTTTTPSNQAANILSPIVLTPRSVSDGESRTWISKIDINCYVNEMKSDRESLQLQQAATALNSGAALSNVARNEIVRFLSDKILHLCKTPTRSSLNSFSELLVTKYPQFKDVIGGTVVGTGYISVQNQLENRLAYLRRPIAASRKNAAVKRRL